MTALDELLNKYNKNVEVKYFDSEIEYTDIQFIDVSWTPSKMDPAGFDCLFCPNQGGSAIERVGRKVQVIGFKVDGHVRYPGGNQDDYLPSVMARVVFYQNHFCNMALPEPFEVLQTTYGGGAFNNEFQCFPNIRYFHKYKILYDKTFVFDFPTAQTNFSTPANYYNGVTHLFSFDYILPDNTYVNFSDINPNVYSIVDNSFHCLAGKNSDFGLELLLNYHTRFYYIDL